MKGLNYLTEAYNVVNNHGAESSERQIEIMREYLKKFFYENIVCGTSKFDMYKFTGDDKNRPCYSGVFHEKGFKVATSGYWLVVIPDTYPSDYEGKNLAKDGTEIKGRYPNYRAAIPCYDEAHDTKFAIDPKRLNEALRKAKAERKINKGADIRICIEGVGFKEDVANKIAVFMNGFPKADAYVRGKTLSERVSYPLVLKHGDNIGVFMPSLIRDVPEEWEVVIDY